jgi:hypothetical protein
MLFKYTQNAEKGNVDPAAYYSKNLQATKKVFKGYLPNANLPIYFSKKSCHLPGTAF